MSLSKEDAAPNFTLQNQNGEKINLDDLKGENVVLLFFPLAFSSVCTEELCSVRDQISDFSELDAKVYGISVDSFFTLKKFKEENKLSFDLLSDFNKTVSTAYDSLYDEFFGMHGVSKRSAFVIDKEGKVIYKEVLDDASKQPDLEAIKAALK